MDVHIGKIDVDPDAVNYNPATLNVLDAHFQGLIEGGMIQAAGYLLARDGKVFAHRAMGRLSAAEDAGDFMPDTIRPIASITKVFTTTGILQLLEQGKIFLKQPVSTIIKEFDTDMHRQITIFHLLTHTSGLRADPGACFEPYPDWRDRREWKKENWITNMLAGPLQYKTGSTWNYASTGFTFLAEIIARVSGMDYDEYIKQHVLKPLGMGDSHYVLPKADRNRVCVVSDWNRHHVSGTKKDMITPSMWGGGGLFSTLEDLWKLGQMMLDGGTFNGQRIIGRKTAEAALKPQIKDFPAHNWMPQMFDNSIKWTCGLGWELNKHPFLTDGTFDHEGAEGAGLYIDPTERFVFVGFYPSIDWHGESWVSPLAIAWSGIR
ncbi:MAG: beta-lactamase family protein [Anaerolineae bacterium]|nr:beta-lactamase family protein [Anaerolineae bacterium]